MRFPTKAHFASYSGTAPLEASSGEVVRHRLSLAGNRKLNSALCTWSPPARAGRTLEAESITARRSGRANLASRRCGVSRGASATQCSGASWRTRRRRRATLLDKEEPRTASPRSSHSGHFANFACVRSSESQRGVGERSSVRRVISSSCSHSAPVKRSSSSIKATLRPLPPSGYLPSRLLRRGAPNISPCGE